MWQLEISALPLLFVTNQSLDVENRPIIDDDGGFALALLDVCDLILKIAMPCTKAGALAIGSTLIAVALSSIALGIPMWSSSTKMSDAAKDIGLLGNVKFSVGVWGYCVNANYDFVQNSTTKLSLDQCFSFYSARDISDALKINGTSVTAAAKEAGVALNMTSEAICDQPNKGAESAVMTPLTPAEYNGFITKTCGSIGKSSLAFSVLAAGFGMLTLISLILLISCCSTKSCFVIVAKIFVVLSFLSSLIAFLCWVGQTRDFDKSSISFGVSFAFGVASCALYLITFIAIYFHQKQARGDADESKATETTA